MSTEFLTKKLSRNEIEPGKTDIRHASVAKTGESIDFVNSQNREGKVSILSIDKIEK